MTDLAAKPGIRTVFIVSDGTGITAETFSHSILAQFEMKFRQVRIPFVDTVDKAHVAVGKINEAFHAEGVRPIVFTTLVDAEANRIVHQGPARPSWTCSRPSSSRWNANWG